MPASGKGGLDEKPLFRQRTENDWFAGGMCRCDLRHRTQINGIPTNHLRLHPLRLLEDEF